MNTLESFGIGDLVNADPFAGDMFDNFTGRIIGRRGEHFIVIDQNDNGRACLPDQLSLATDDATARGF